MNKHNNNALSICKYVLDSMIYRQKLLGEEENLKNKLALIEEYSCLLYTSPSPRDSCASRMPSSA